MKKSIIIILLIFLLFMFLVYCGVFRDYTNPLLVTKYYFDHLRNGEWFLTYRIYKPEFFNSYKIFQDFIDYYFQTINEIKLSLIEIVDNIAFVQAYIVYKDKHIVTSIVELHKENQVWRIRKVEYKK